MELVHSTACDIYINNCISHFYLLHLKILTLIKCGKTTHFIKCRRRSVTNLADFTIGLPGSLNVRVLCSMYRTSHIREETRLKQTKHKSLNLIIFKSICAQFKSKTF